MAEPIPISPNTDTTFLVKWDLNFKDIPLSSSTSTPIPAP